MTLIVFPFALVLILAGLVLLTVLLSSSTGRKVLLVLACVLGVLVGLSTLLFFVRLGRMDNLHRAAARAERVRVMSPADNRVLQPGGNRIVIHGKRVVLSDGHGKRIVRPDGQQISPADDANHSDLADDESEAEENVAFHIAPMRVSWMLAIGSFVVLAGIALVVMLADPRTRVATLVMLGACVLLLPPILLFGWLTCAPSASPATVAAPPPVLPVPAVPPVPPVAPAPPTVDPPAAKPEAKLPDNAAAKPNEPKPIDAKAEVPALAARPKWIVAPDGYVGDTYEMTVASGPYATDLECDAAVAEKACQKIEDYGTSIYSDSGKPLAGWLPPEMIRARLKKWAAEPPFRETVNTSVGPMRQAFLRLAMDAKAKRWFDAEFRRAAVDRRLSYFGAGLAGALAILTAAWALLRRAPKCA